MSNSHAVTESTPLLSGNQNGVSPTSHLRSSGNLITDSPHHDPENEAPPTFATSFRYFFLGSWFNILLVFIPLSFISHFLIWDAALVFSFSFLSIIPLAKLLGDATDQLSLKLNQTVAGLLNASFGNAVEIIVGIAALLQGELRIVQTSMIGSILSNLLLVLGCSFFAGGLLYNESFFQETAAQAQSSLLLLACITLVIPAAYRSAFDKTRNNERLNLTQTVFLNTSELSNDPNANDPSEPGLLIFSRGTAILLLFVYFAYLYFELRSHSYLFQDKKREDMDDSVAPTPAQDVVEEKPMMNVYAAGIGLLITTLVTSFCADYLVGSIEETATRYKIPRPFIGTILLPIVGNAAEHVTSVWMARKDKMELTIGVCVGSSIQIATFVIPLLVIVGWISDHPLTLFFENFETIVLFVSVLLVNLLIMDGKSNYMEGLFLITLYLVIAIAFWVSL